MVWGVLLLMRRRSVFGLWMRLKPSWCCLCLCEGLACTEESREGWMRAGFSRVEGALYGQFKA